MAAATFATVFRTQNKHARPNLPSVSPYCCRKWFLWAEENSGTARESEGASENI